MSTLGLDLTDVVLQLQTIATYFSRAEGSFISDVVDLPTGEDESFMQSLPCAWVIPGGDDLAENDTGADINQKLDETFSVIVALDTTANEYGTAYRNLKVVRAQLWSALLGWTPTDCEGQIEYVGSDLIRASRAMLLWEFQFKVASAIGYPEGYQFPEYGALMSVMMKFLFNRAVKGAVSFITDEPTDPDDEDRWISLEAGTAGVTGQTVEALTGYEWDSTQPEGERWVKLDWDSQALVEVEGG